MRGVLHLCACALLLVLTTLPSTQGQVQDSRCNFYQTLPLPNTCTSNCGGGFGACTRAGTICCPFGASGRCSYCVSAPATCPSITSVSNGNVLETTVNNQRRLTFSCNNGFRLVGTSLLTCQGTLWSAAFPTCESTISTNCQTLLINNAILSTNEVFNGVVVTLLCTGGTRLPGGNTITTLTCNRGLWSQNPLPTCTGTLGTCPPLTIANGLISTSNVFNGVIVDVLCRTGFTLGAQISRITCSNGAWTPAVPTCSRISAPTCPRITIPNGFLSNQNVSEGAIVSVVCTTGYTLGQQSATIRCFAGNWLPAIPTCQRASCPALVIPNAVFSPTTTTVNTQVRVVCNAGFSIVGSSVITCSSTGSWLPAIPICRAVFCTPLTAPLNGVITSGTGASMVNSVTTFACNGGFQLAGSSRRTCQQNGVWDGVAPVCNRIIITCSIPGPPENGQRSVSGDGSVGTVIAFTCNPGFVLRGAGVIRCQSNGQFDQAFPVCVRAFCTEIANPTNGQKNVTGNIAPGSAVQFACAPGFRLEGFPILVCLTNGAYDRPAPICRRVTQCQIHPTQANRQDSYSGDRVVNSFVQFTCTSGFFLQGSSSLRCQSNGQWDGGPPSCQVLSCPAVPRINNGQALSSDNRINAQASYRCNSGYVLSFNEPLRCIQPAPNQQPRWDRNPPVCSLAACGPPPGIENGSPINPNDRQVNAQVRYQCTGGYQLSENIILTCRVQSNGQLNWDRAPPQCIRSSCSAPPTIANGSPSTNGNFIGAVATYTCNSGYTLVGNTRLVCRDFGQTQFPRWDNTPPTCTAVRCQSVSAPRWGQISSSDNAIGSTVQVTCSGGYQISGPGLLTCRLTGSGPLYTPNVPSCNPITCMALISPRFGRVDVQGDRVPNAVARYSCDNGYNLDGPSQVTCRTNGVWSGNAPICVPVNCGNQLPDFANAITRLPNDVNTAFGSSVDLPCVNGFMPDSITVFCSQRATWETVGRCVAAPQCPGIHSPNSGGMNVDGVTLSFRCNPGFERQGPMSITCRNGVWSSLPPVCIPIPGGCSPPPTPVNGLRPQLISGNEGSVNAIYRFQCFPGYDLVGERELRCQGNGGFNAQVPTCRRSQRCEQIFRDPVNGQVRYVTDNGRPRADFFCNPGFILRGSQMLFCTDNQWRGNPPTCERQAQQCQALVIPGVDIRIADDGSNATFSCPNGFTLSGTSVVLCQGTEWQPEPTPQCSENSGTPCPQIGLNPAEFLVNYTRDNVGQLMATFTCVDPRLVSDPPSATCQFNRWTNTQPICRPRTAAVTCRVLNVRSGRVEYFEGSTQVGAQNGQLRSNTVARVSCPAGSNLNGDSQLTCQSNGVWTGREPNECIGSQPTQCPGVPAVTNGRLEYSADRGTVRMICNSGFTANGPTVFTCQTNRVWNPTLNTQCVGGTSDNICGVLNLDTNVFDIRYSDQGRLGSVATFSCRDSNLAPEPASATCQSNRAWSNTQPQCRQTGRVTTCLAFTVSGASTSYFDGNTPVNPLSNVQRVNAGTRASVQCSGSLDGPSNLVCQANGQWNGTPPRTCTPSAAASCEVFAVGAGATQYLEGAVVINPAVGSRVRVQTTVRVQCNQGATLQGDSILTCQSNGLWNGNQNTPRCITTAVGCLSFGVAGATVRYFQGNNPINPNPGVDRVSVGTRVNVICVSGPTPLSGNKDRECQSNGQWTGVQPTCGSGPTAAQCSALVVQNGRAAYTNFGSPGSRATVICNNGDGSESICTGGSWLPRPITCQTSTRP